MDSGAKEPSYEFVNHPPKINYQEGQEIKRKLQKSVVNSRNVQIRTHRAIGRFSQDKFKLIDGLRLSEVALAGTIHLFQGHEKCEFRGGACRGRGSSWNSNLENLYKEKF